VPKARSSKEKKSRAVAIDTDVERNIALRLLLSHPKDMIAGAIAFAAVTAIVANALFLQAGRHPSPMFGSSIVVPLAGPTNTVNLLPKPRPLEAATPAENRAADNRLLEGKPILPKAEPKAAEPAVSAKSLATPANVTRPPAAVPTPVRSDPLGDMITTSRRVATVQRMLTEYGYGQLKPTGTVGSDTQAAIQKFERDRKIPVTGQMSERMVRELVAMTGRPID
jgi:hypothetical protein